MQYRTCFTRKDWKLESKPYRMTSPFFIVCQAVGSFKLFVFSLYRNIGHEWHQFSTTISRNTATNHSYATCAFPPSPAQASLVRRMRCTNCICSEVYCLPSSAGIGWIRMRCTCPRNLKIHSNKFLD